MTTTADVLRIPTEGMTMYSNAIGRIILALVLAAALSGCSNLGGMASTASLYEQIGGSNAVTKLAGNFLQSAASDGRLTSLLGQADMSALTPAVANQFCSELGGGCKAPLSAQQIAEGAKQVNPTQAAALSDALSGALDKSGTNSAVQSAVTQSIGSKLGGIMGGLL
jgi:hypothetical protein